MSCYLVLYLFFLAITTYFLQYLAIWRFLILPYDILWYLLLFGDIATLGPTGNPTYLGFLQVLYLQVGPLSGMIMGVKSHPATHTLSDPPTTLLNLKNIIVTEPTWNLTYTRNLAGLVLIDLKKITEKNFFCFGPKNFLTNFF